MTESKKLWIEKGYLNFAAEGPSELKIQRLAKSLGKNKSSFYHYFATIELFHDELLVKHLFNIRSMAEKFKVAESKQELILILLDYKSDLLFNRQLRVHRHVNSFQNCFMKTNEIVGDSIIDIWKEILGLENNSYLARLVLKLSVENFFLQITKENLNDTWLEDYFLRLSQMVSAFRNRESIGH